MSPRGQRKQVVLFLIAVIFPSLVLVALTLRMINQERELSEKRWTEERRRLSSEIGQQLLVRLEKIKLEEMGALESQPEKHREYHYVNPEVVLVGRVEQNRLLLPWELDRRSKEVNRSSGETRFTSKIRQAEEEEFLKKQFARAAELYRESMNEPRLQGQVAFARLSLARVLAKAGHTREAQAHYREILLLPSEVTDEQGIPLSLYAAVHLLERGVEHQTVLQRITSELETTILPSPAEFYILRGLAETLARSGPDGSVRAVAGNIHRRILERISHVEQALELQSDFAHLVLTPSGRREPQSREPVWVPYGEETWLVSLTPSLTGSQPWLLAVQASEILPSLATGSPLSKTFPGKIHLLTDREAEGESLGPNFPGLKVAFVAQKNPISAGPWSLHGYFYLVTLLLVLSVTLFGAYLLWRDVRRELRVAEMRSQFVSSVSHELKTPLTAIRMFAETLRMGRFENPRIKDEYLATIVNESERLSRLLNNVLDFSKIERGKKIYDRKPTSLAGIVEAAARTMQYPLTQLGFKLDVEVENDIPPIRVDRDAMEQAILNLLTNAMKYSGESRRIGLRVKRQNGHALIEVSDEGVGIDAKEQAHIFEKFYRVSTPDNQLIPGAGLGLPLVAHIAKAHGGRVEVRSTPRRGSTFSIHLPLESEG
ncbi:HAMP domain-containing histidine kinase [Acidobacteria bacterium AH-259-G07]|nr:HAMP domain-containing histidine kinase [Acidobacteria bacterium AH-259-G07]